MYTLGYADQPVCTNHDDARACAMYIHVYARAHGVRVRCITFAVR